MAYSTTPPAAGRIQSLVSKGGALTKLAIAVRDTSRTRHFRPDTRGTGYLAGEYPGGTTTIDGVPTNAIVRVLLRESDSAQDGYVVAKANSSVAGTWGVYGLDTDKRYDIVGRKDGYNDVIASNVAPTRTDIIEISGSFGPTEYFDGLDGFMTITTGLPPFYASVVENLPDGLMPEIGGRVLRIVGDSFDVGVWRSTVRVTSVNGVYADVDLEIEIKNLRDPHFANVVSLLLFDGDAGDEAFEDQTGRVWAPRGGASVTDQNPIFGKTSASLFWPAYLETGPSQDLAFFDGDFTIEGWINVGLPVGGGLENDRQIFGSFEYSPPMVFFLERTNNSLALWDGSIQHTSANVIPENEWAHFAYSRNNNVLRIFVNGELGYSSGIYANFSYAARSFVGSNGGVNRSLNGLLGPFRVTKGVGRYDSDFTPPDKPFPKK